MLLFLASVLEQMDLALEHVLKGDVHNARFGVMLTDNALELILHQIARDQAAENKYFSFRQETYQHQAALEKALGRVFGDKVAFARLTGKMTDEVAQTVVIMHAVRNEVYHIGLQHEAILPALSVFYFEVVCGFLKDYKPRYFGWGSNQSLPERSRKYFTGHHTFPGKIEDFSNGCVTLSRACIHDKFVTINALADHLDQIIEEQDTCIGIIAEGAYAHQRTTRDKAVVGCQVWPLAFSEDGLAFAQARNFTGNRLDLIEWLGQNYPLRFRGDPVQGWRKRAEKLRNETNPHTALRHYKSFLTETDSLRESVSESAAACEQEIESAIERMREN